MERGGGPERRSVYYGGISVVNQCQLTNGLARGGQRSLCTHALGVTAFSEEKMTCSGWDQDERTQDADLSQ